MWCNSLSPDAGSGAAQLFLCLYACPKKDVKADSYHRTYTKMDKYPRSVRVPILSFPLHDAATQHTLHSVE